MPPDHWQRQDFARLGFPPVVQKLKKSKTDGRRFAIQAGDILIVMTAKFARTMLAAIAFPLFFSSEHGLTQRVFL